MKKPKSVREPLQVYLDGTERAWLDEVAESEGVSRSEVLRRSVRLYRAERLVESPMLKLLDEVSAEGHAAEGDVARRHDDYLADAYAPLAAGTSRRRKPR